jgi:hypothetical protein
VTVWKTDTDLQQTTNPGPTTFKVICISASVFLANKNVDWKSYEQVKKVLNLQD